MAAEIQEQDKATWSEGGQIFFCGDKAWGVAPDLRTICLGKEAEITDALENNKATGNKTIDNILAMEINNRGNEILPVRPTLKRHQTKNKRRRRFL